MKRIPLLALIPLFALSSLASCSGCKRTHAVDDAAPPVASATAAPVTPATPVADGGLGSRWPTTSFNIAGSNLDGEIADRLRRDPNDPHERLRLIELLLLRGQYLATIGDYERADTLSDSTIKSHPKNGEAHLGRAFAHGSLHRFEAALRELDEAAKLGAPAQRVFDARANIFLTTGRYDEALKLLPPPGDASRPLELATAAVLAGRMQNHDEAERLFERARSRIRDVSPFPIAWMDYQRASLLDARGRETQARAYYEEACDAIPPYVHAVVHLASSEPPERAIPRLEALRKKPADPDLLAALAEAHRKAGHAEEAKQATEEARARYEALLAKHPEAFWDHAARFWLGPGSDPKKALELAEKNAQLRPTEEALDLFMAAAAAANRPEKICASAAQMNQLRWVSPERKRLAAAALTACPDAPAK